jgi:hypothetical protein
MESIEVHSATDSILAVFGSLSGYCHGTGLRNMLPVDSVDSVPASHPNTNDRREDDVTEMQKLADILPPMSARTKRRISTRFSGEQAIPFLPRRANL